MKRFLLLLFLTPPASASVLTVDSATITELSASTATITNLKVAGVHGDALATKAAPFRSDMTYVGIGSTEPFHLLESYEEWNGDNSTRWVNNNSGNGYAVTEARICPKFTEKANPLLGTASAKIFAAGLGANQNWVAGTPIANSAGLIISSAAHGIIHGSDSDLLIITEHNDPISFWPNNTLALDITGPGRILQPKQSQFVARKTATSFNVTGDGTGLTVIFDSKTLDPQGEYSTGTGVFSAANGGLFLLCSSVQLTGLDGTQTYATMEFTCSTGNFSKRQSLQGTLDQSLNFCALVPMADDATVKVSVSVSGGNKSVDILGNTERTFFTGTQIN